VNVSGKFAGELIWRYCPCPLRDAASVAGELTLTAGEKPSEKPGFSALALGVMPATLGVRPPPSLGVVMLDEVSVRFVGRDAGCWVLQQEA